jgi:uncharacterized protein (DUF1330 family)
MSTVAFFGVQVIDPALYVEYRARIAPMLEAHGGRFEVDVRVAEVLKAPASEGFNRLFSLRFGSTDRLEAFFADPAYLAVRRDLLARAVSAIVPLGRYEVVA